MLYRLTVDLLAALFGLMAGSYLNVVIHRVPLGRSTVLPRSRCPYCGGAILPWDNIPLVSYLILRGRCRLCSAPISARYPAVELLAAVTLVSCVERFGLTPQALVAILFLGLLLVLAVIDLEHFLLPDRLTLPGIVLGLALQPWLPATRFLDALLGVLAGAGVLILVINFWYWLRSEEGMGMGDVNMLAMVGAFLGWQGVISTLFLAAAAGSVVGLGLIAAGRLGLRSRLPFGVFLAFGAAVSLFAAERLEFFYNRLL